MRNEEAVNSLKERGLRLKQLRELMDVKRQDFAKKVGVTRVTLSYWENASTTLKGGLHEEAAKRVIAVADDAGIICRLHWLLHGVGEAPCSKDKYQGPHKDYLLMDQEIEVFLACSDLAIIASITDSSMSPIVEPGDTVGGLWQAIDSITLFDKTYIVEIDNGLQVRRIRKADTEGCYDVFAINESADSNHPVELKNIELTRVAPIVRLWR